MVAQHGAHLDVRKATHLAGQVGAQSLTGAWVRKPGSLECSTLPSGQAGQVGAQSGACWSSSRLAKWAPSLVLARSRPQRRTPPPPRGEGGGSDTGASSPEKIGVLDRTGHQCYTRVMNIEWLDVERMVVARIRVLGDAQEGLCRVETGGEDVDAAIRLVLKHLLLFVTSIRLPPPRLKPEYIFLGPGGQFRCLSYEPSRVSLEPDCEGDARVRSGCEECSRFKGKGFV